MYRKKVLSNAVALSLGLSAAGVIGVAHADADLLFPYVVSGDNVTTLLSVVNTAPPTVVGRPGQGLTYNLDIALNYKLGAVNSAWNRDGCFHFDRTITTSVFDLSTFDIGGKKFGAGALFNDTIGGSGDFLNDVATFPGFRGYVHIQDTTPNLPAGPNAQRTLEGDALIIEFDTGAAWGYRGLSRSDALGDTSWFQNLSNATYDVYPNIPDLAAERGLNIPFMPMDQVNTRFFITVLNDDVNRQFNGTPGAVIAQMGGGAGQTLFNRLEQSRSLNASIQIDCFGVVDVQDFLAAAAGTPFMAQGGFSRLNIRDANPITGVGTEGLGLVDGKLAHIMKLEWALDPVAIDGEPVNGTFNNSYQLNYVTNALEAGGVFPVPGWSVADRVTS